MLCESSMYLSGALARPLWVALRSAALDSEEAPMIWTGRSAGSGGSSPAPRRLISVAIDLPDPTTAAGRVTPQGAVFELAVRTPSRRQTTWIRSDSAATSFRA